MSWKMRVAGAAAATTLAAAGITVFGAGTAAAATGCNSATSSWHTTIRICASTSSNKVVASVFGDDSNSTAEERVWLDVYSTCYTGQWHVDQGTSGLARIHGRPYYLHAYTSCPTSALFFATARITESGGITGGPVAAP